MKKENWMWYALGGLFVAWIIWAYYVGFLPTLFGQVKQATGSLGQNTGCGASGSNAGSDTPASASVCTGTQLQF